VQISRAAKRKNEFKCEERNLPYHIHKHIVFSSWDSERISQKAKITNSGVAI
jgi:hypothetical protein